MVPNYLALRLVRTPAEALLLIAASAFLFRFYRKKEDTRWRPVAMMVVVLAFLIWIERPLWWDPMWLR
ncbi:MAG TPA: hypothetical protein DIW24_03645, partial [Bacteroidetes bacterium]|nr:hypothetical protein [Bacteroidota bacterium]